MEKKKKLEVRNPQANYLNPTQVQIELLHQLKVAEWIFTAEKSVSLVMAHQET